MTEQLADVLDECIDLLASGEFTLDECVARWPELAIELRSLLSTALQFVDASNAASNAPAPLPLWRRTSLREASPFPRTIAFARFASDTL